MVYKCVTVVNSTHAWPLGPIVKALFTLTLKPRLESMQVKLYWVGVDTSNPNSILINQPTTGDGLTWM